MSPRTPGKATASEPDRLVTATVAVEEDRVENQIRPRRLSEYVGQPAVCERLGIYLDAARKRSENAPARRLHGHSAARPATLRREASWMKARACRRRGSGKG